MAWCEAMKFGRAWDEARDRPRIRQAFVQISATMTRWPQVSELMAALPAVPEVAALPARASDPERAARMIAELARELGMKAKV